MGMTGFFSFQIFQLLSDVPEVRIRRCSPMNLTHNEVDLLVPSYLFDSFDDIQDIRMSRPVMMMVLSLASSVMDCPLPELPNSPG
jgi:hypothetical protein